MNHPDIREELLNQLDRLPLELQIHILNFAKGLTKSTSKGTQGKKLLRFSGIIGAQDAQEILEAVEAGCEGVDSNEW